MDVLLQSFAEHSLVWIILSAGFGGLVGALVKFTFEQVLGPRYQRATEARVALRKYTYPLLRAADSLDARVDNMIRFVDKGWFDQEDDDYYKTSTLYLFGCYFGWCKILESEAFLEYETSNKKASKFSIIFYRVFKGINSYYYFKDVENEMQGIENATVQRMALTAIGELMIKRKEDSKQQLEIVDFVDFAKSYSTSGDFKKWFSYLEKILSGVTKSPSDPKWNRIIVFSINLRVLINFLDRSRRQTAPRSIEYLDLIHPKVAQLLHDELAASGYTKIIRGQVSQSPPNPARV